MLTTSKRQDGYGEFSVAGGTVVESSDSPVTLSVILSVWNAKPHLSACLQSIRLQTFNYFECILIDDGSTDGSSAVLREFCIGDPRFFLVEQPNMGLTKSLNRGIALARGRYIARHDADDISHPERFSKQIVYLLNNPQTAIVGTGVTIIDDVGAELYAKPAEHVLYKDVFRILQKRNCMVHGSVMCNYALLQEKLQYDERFRYAQDYELFSRISLSFPVENIREPLYSLRVSSTSISKRKVEEQCYFTALVSCRNRGRGDFPAPPSPDKIQQQCSQIACLRSNITMLLLLNERADIPSKFYPRWHPFQMILYLLNTFPLIQKLKSVRRLILKKLTPSRNLGPIKNRDFWQTPL